MKKKLGISLIIFGAVLFLAALSLVLYNRLEDKRASEAANEILGELEEVIPNYIKGNASTENQNGNVNQPIPTLTPGGILNEYTPEVEKETVVECDGISYLGVVSIPSMGVELPVTSDWNYDLMKFAACRYTGTVAETNLIICAHNLASFFSGIGNLNSGDSIVFIDAKGEYHYYEVIEISTVGGYDTEMMKEGSDGWDITLFSCTYGGANRVAVRAVEVD